MIEDAAVPDEDVTSGRQTSAKEQLRPTTGMSRLMVLEKWLCCLSSEEDEDLEKWTKDSSDTEKPEAFVGESQKRKPVMSSPTSRAEVSGQLSDYLHGTQRGDANKCL